MKRTAKDQFLLNWDEGDTDNSPTKMERHLEKVIIEAQQQVKNLNIPAAINCVPYQVCPKCAGDGDLFRYHSPALMSTNARPICDVCDGKKIIPMAHCL
jgi:hypothetical protein